MRLYSEKNVHLQVAWTIIFQIFWLGSLEFNKEGFTLSQDSDRVDRLRIT